jgi:multicomponent Na+:H+ antiporter subunit E
MTFAAPDATAVSATFRLRQCLARTVWMVLLWLGLNGLDGPSWIVGGPVVLTAAWISVKLLPAISWRWSLRGALLFGAYFLVESVRGGWDVARRAISPGMALSPALVCHVFHLPAGPSRLFFCSALSLLPGTAVVAMAEHNICVHVLDSATSAAKELRELEQRVAALFGVELVNEKGPAV